MQLASTHGYWGGGWGGGCEEVTAPVPDIGASVLVTAMAVCPLALHASSDRTSFSGNPLFLWEHIFDDAVQGQSRNVTGSCMPEPCCTTGRTVAGAQLQLVQQHTRLMRKGPPTMAAA